MFIEEIGEFGLIEKITRLIQTKQARDDKIIAPVGDDAAVVATGPGIYTILTTDSLIQNVHFKMETITPFALGYKALAINLSDVAAMAGAPKYALVSLGLPTKTEVEFVEEMYKGMLDCGSRYGVRMVGGDTSRAAILIINVVLFGEVELSFLRRRNEARVGDKILVTGQLGASAAGLALILEPTLLKNTEQEDILINAHFFPTPRIKEAQIASKEGARAMEDISDGLASEIWHISEESQVGARIFSERIPIAQGVQDIASRTNRSGIELALFGGEDYEIVFTAPEAMADKIKAKVEVETQTVVTDIGEIVSEKEGLSLVDEKGRVSKISAFGYEHFRQ